MTEDSTPAPDLTRGYRVSDIPDGGLVQGRVGDEEVLLARHGDTVFAVGAYCTHYHAPLRDGLVVGDTIRCPWHHSCFSLRTGEATRAPALDAIACWRVERDGDVVSVRDRRAPAALPAPRVAPASVVIVGGGGAGLAAAEMLRREGYGGPVTMISADEAPPCDRPNLSKDFLAGTADPDWIPLKPDEFYRDQRIDLVLNARVAAIDTVRRHVRLEDGSSRPFGALLLATGADPVRLDIPGAAPSQVHYLRTFADSRALIARAASGTRVLVVGASFIGLEVAASLRARGLEVHVVAPETLPLERVMGAEMGRFLKGLHEAHGVIFHLGTTVARLDGRAATLSTGVTIDADLVVAGVGVRPSIGLAADSGLTIDKGVVVDEYLETSARGVFAAGDVARWPDPMTGDRIRVEHWAVAQQQGQTAARNILGCGERFRAVPFFWSHHYDITINYVGHADSWDELRVDGTLDAHVGDHGCTLTFLRGGRTLAVATVARDLESLKVEARMESVR